MPNGEVESVFAHLRSAAHHVCKGIQPKDLPEPIFEPLNYGVGINLYQMVLPIGTGPFDCIKISRVVKEQAPGRAVDGKAAALFIHGVGQTFGSQFIHRQTFPEHPGIAPWLAEQGIDVWGIDLRYTLVPLGTTHFGFMAEWGMARMRDDVLLAAWFARRVRRTLDEHFGRLHLVGQSLGAAVLYAVADQETTLPEKEQNIGDIIPIETIYKFDASTAYALGPVRIAEQLYRDPFRRGFFALDDKVTVSFGGKQMTIGQRAAGQAAQSLPGGDSPFPGMNNEQLALTMVWQPWFPGLPAHHVACSLGTDGLPSDCPYSPKGLAFDFLAHTAPFVPSRLLADFYGIPAGNPDLPYADHLAEILIPSMHIGVSGGFGAFGLCMRSLLGPSDDRDLLFIDKLSSGQAKDFGHIEPHIAHEAQTLIWEPLLRWIQRHDLTLSTQESEQPYETAVA